MTTLPTFFLSHGGGPWPYMKNEYGTTYDLLKASLQEIPKQLGMTPKAILMISAHWQEADFTVMTSPKPGMIYDYFGFPDYTYHISYPASGSPELAQQVQDMLSAAGLKTNTDGDRGFDHGTYSALFPMYPDADIPVVQLSLKNGLDPAIHIALGRALAPLRNQGILIVGSGLSYHNLRKFGSAGQIASAEFDAWLQNSLMKSPAERIEQLNAWSKAPCARDAHPQEEHLLPLMVAVGAAENEAATCIYHETAFYGCLTVSSYKFG